MRFDLVDLSLFVAVADTRSITGGAAQANLALPSASERIKRLETALGAPLVERRRRGVVLTAAGESLLGHARVVLHQVDAMRGDIAAFARGMKAHVRLLANTSSAMEYLPAALAPFLVAHPDFSVDIDEMESVDVLRTIASGAADIGVASDAALPPGLDSVTFCEDRLVLIVPSRDELAGRKQVSFTEVAGRKFVGLASGALQNHIGAQAARLGIRPQLRVRVKGFDAVCRMVENGVGAAIVPEIAARRNAQAMKIRIVRMSDAWTHRRLAVCVRDRKTLARPVRQLFDHLRQVARV
ncbi:MAG: LysR family transcriptional regulator [Proteobacteria bacterium SG_bin9]|nr:MAG: LysR family transcriptional regulator [Proteobacteria bacterium SG_bin9]